MSGLAADQPSMLYCSFCGTSQDETLLLIRGPAALICDKCVDSCMRLVKKKRKDVAGKPLMQETVQ
jgi:ATP-dependent Clp protease ATP-binding subunit ClpX